MNELRRINDQLVSTGLDREADMRLIRAVSSGLASLPASAEGPPKQWTSPHEINHAAPKDTDRFPQEEIRYSLRQFHATCTSETCPYMRHMKALLYKLIKTGEESGSLVSRPETYSFPACPDIKDE